MRGGAGPPPQLSWLPPAFEGGPGLRQRQQPRRPAEVKPSCGGLGRRGVGRRPTRAGWAGLGGCRGREVEGRLGILGAGPSRAGGQCVLFPGRPPQRHLQKGPQPGASASGKLWEGRGSVPSGRLSRGPLRGLRISAGLRGACYVLALGVLRKGMRGGEGCEDH